MFQKLCLRNTGKFILFDSCDIDFDLITLVLKLDLDIMVTYFYAQNEVKSSFGSKIIAWKDTHIHTQMCAITFTSAL